jgi:hypothetical protein
MSNELTGIIKVIGKTNQVTATFEKRELVIEVTEGEYSNVGVFEATQDKCGVLDGFQVGQLVTVAFFWSGRTDPWTDKNGVDRYFNSLKIASISKVVAESEPFQQAPQQQAAPAPAFVAPPMPEFKEELSEDIPF